MRRVVSLSAVCPLVVMCLQAFTVLAVTPSINLEQVVTGLNEITSIVSPHDGSPRLFITQETGEIKIFSNGQLLSTNFLTKTGMSTGGEEGLLGLVFSPGYKTNGIFYITYTATNGNVTLSRYSVSTNPNVANPTEQVL